MGREFQYIDGVGNVSVVNGMAHIDLVVVRPSGVEGQQPQVEPVQHLVMALPQFVRLCAEMAGHLHRMEQKGLITRRATEDAPGQSAAPGAQPATKDGSDGEKARGFFGRG